MLLTQAPRSLKTKQNKQKQQTKPRNNNKKNPNQYLFTWKDPLCLFLLYQFQYQEFDSSLSSESSLYIQNFHAYQSMNRTWDCLVYKITHFRTAKWNSLVTQVFHKQDVTQMLLNSNVAIPQLIGVGAVNLSVIWRSVSSHSALADYRKWSFCHHIDSPIPAFQS